MRTEFIIDSGWINLAYLAASILFILDASEAATAEARWLEVTSIPRNSRHCATVPSGSDFMFS